MTINKKKLILNRILSIIQIALGGFLTFFLTFGISVELSKEPMDVGVIIFAISFDILAIQMMCCGIKRSRMMPLWKQYAVLVGNAPSVEIRELSRFTKKSEKTVKRHFEWFIEKGFLPNVYIDYEENEVIFKAAYDKTIMEEKWKLRKKLQIKETGKVSVICECCNAIAMIPMGSSSLCEYCRAPIGTDKEKIDCEETDYEMEKIYN